MNESCSDPEAFVPITKLAEQEFNSGELQNNQEFALGSRYRLWPAGVRRELAVVDPYGRFVRWLANRR